MVTECHFIFIQIQNGNGYSPDGYGQFRLNGGYTTLKGTLYGDDAVTPRARPSWSIT